MYKKIKALTWLRTQILLTNSSLLMSVLLPFGLLFLYNMILNKNGNAGQGLLKMILPMTFAMSGGYMVSIMMAEDKEKRNLKTLMLSGVRSTEYLLSMLVYPFLFTVFALLFFPILFACRPLWQMAYLSFDQSLHYCNYPFNQSFYRWYFQDAITSSSL